MNNPPAKLDKSVDDLRPFYGKLTVLLHGEEVARCVAYDTLAGTVRHLATHPDGKLIVRGGEVEEITRHGRVEVRWKQHV